VNSGHAKRRKVRGKPLSAEADSFSLPDPDRGGWEVRLVYGSPAADVDRSDGISGSGVPAGYTGEKGLRNTVTLIAKSTPGASLRGMPGVYQAYQDAGQSGVVLDKPTQLVESPGVLLSPLALANRDSGTDAREFFKGNPSSSVFSPVNNPPADNVVGMCGKPSLFFRALFQKSLCLLGTVGLEPGADLRVTLSKPVDLSTGVSLTIGVGSDILNPQVDAKKLGRVIPWRLFHLACLQKVKFFLPVNEVRLTGKVLKQLKLMLSGNKKKFQTAAIRPDGYSLPRQVPGKDTFIIGDTAMSLEGALGGTVKLVGIGHLRQYPNHYLGRQIKPAPYVVVEKVVKVILAKSLCLPGMVADIVGRVVHRLKSNEERFMLLFGRLQLNLGNQLHACIIAYRSRFEKGGRPAFLCQLKQAVSCG